MDQGPRPQGSNLAAGETPVQHVAVNVYETEGDIVLVAPMPGVEAQNIDIEVVGSTVTVRSELRGPDQANREYLIHEWTYGPYERTVELPVEVNGEHANASHGNGVLVVSLPKGHAGSPAHVPLHQTTSSEANRRGHSGHHTSRQGLDTQESQ
jgi:HSP20 family protein